MAQPCRRSDKSCAPPLALSRAVVLRREQLTPLAKRLDGILVSPSARIDAADSGQCLAHERADSLPLGQSRFSESLSQRVERIPRDLQTHISPSDFRFELAHRQLDPPPLFAAGSGPGKRVESSPKLLSCSVMAAEKHQLSGKQPP